MEEMTSEEVKKKIEENEEQPVLSVQDLHTSFFTDKGEVKAVNGVSFNLHKGKILGVVGESARENPLRLTLSCRFWRRPDV